MSFSDYYEVRLLWTSAPGINDQKRVYEMEDEIRNALDEVKEKIDFNDKRVQGHIRQTVTPYLLLDNDSS